MTQQQEHRNGPFIPPDDVNTTIWRYLDFQKFVALLETESLWFSRIDYLDDPYEGSTPRGDSAFWDSVIGSNPEKTDVAEYNRDAIRRFVRMSREATYVNCWHVNERESAAMWYLYSKDGSSVAIKSSYPRLRSVLMPEIQIGMVRYIDYEAESIPFGNILNYFMHKRRSFDHERELRALIWMLGEDMKKIENEIELTETGINIEVSLDELVAEVVLAPESPPWFESLVKNVVLRYGRTMEVLRSEIENVPLL